MKVSGPARVTVDVRTLIERQVRRWDRVAAVLKKPAGNKPLAVVTHRPVLTVSGSVGGGRERLSVALCKAFDYDLYGSELLDAVAADLRCQRKLVECLDERVQSNISVMFESLISGRQIENQDYMGALFRVMSALAEKGGAVILGRGGAFILGDRAALRIRVDAPFPCRLLRIMEGWNMSENEARRLIETKTKEQERFCSHYFHRAISDPLAYDLTISTERLEPEQAVDLVRSALAERGIEIRRTAA